MTTAEGAIMQEHSGYWGRLIAERTVVVYGPVMDPAGTYGIAVIEVADREAAQKIASGDPVTISQAGFRFELHPMPDTMIRQ
jgi:uncharacterized protein YciI